MGQTATLTISDSGIRIVTPPTQRDELFRWFSDHGIECMIQRRNDGTEMIVFLSPYHIDKIMTMFRDWQRERGHAEDSPC